jgi:hippurate hydrolase
MTPLPTLLADAGQLTALRRDIHAHPELGFREQRTSDLIAAKLEEWGIPCERGLGKTGVVGVLKHGSSSRALGLRADMDALPITEHNRFEHHSQHAGAMHACGHDGHVAMLLAAAKHLARQRHFDGTVYFVFQPAEESGGGAREMLRDGLFTRFPMDAIYGMHNWPGLAAGQFAVTPGPAFASSNEFRVTIRGKGAHAAMPHLGVDPIPVACQLVQAFQTILTRNKRPIDTGVISVTMLRAGEAVNVIPDSCELRGTVRTFSADVLDLIERRMTALTQSTCAAYEASGEFQLIRGYPATVNHPAESELVRNLLCEVVGPDNVKVFEPTMGAEDFSFFLQEKPGCYFVIGNGDGVHRQGGHGAGPCMLHNPSYDFNDALIPIGASAWVRLVEKCLPLGAR